jgi:hypothetical protein
MGGRPARFAVPFPLAEAKFVLSPSFVGCSQL